MNLERFEPEPDSVLRMFEAPKILDLDPDWIKIGFDEQGRLIQRNLKTKQIRVLSKWVEFIENPNV